MQDVLDKPIQPPALELILQRYVCKSPIEQTILHEENVQSLEKTSVPIVVIDWQACVRMCNGNPDFAHKLLTIFTEDLKIEKEKLVKYYVAHDTKLLCEELHRIRGGICYLKLPQLEDALENFHQTVKSKQQNPQQLEETFSELQQAINDFEKTFENKLF